MAFCGTCGASLEVDEKFCGHCGTAAPDIAPPSDSDSSQGVDLLPEGLPQPVETIDVIDKQDTDKLKAKQESAPPIQQPPEAPSSGTIPPASQAAPANISSGSRTGLWIAYTIVGGIFALAMLVIAVAGVIYFTEKDNATNLTHNSKQIQNQTSEVTDTVETSKTSTPAPAPVPATSVILNFEEADLSWDEDGKIITERPGDENPGNHLLLFTGEEGDTGFFLPFKISNAHQASKLSFRVQVPAEADINGDSVTFRARIYDSDFNSRFTTASVKPANRWQEVTIELNDIGSLREAISIDVLGAISPIFFDDFRLQPGTSTVVSGLK